MSKFRKILRSPVTSIALFAVAAVLLITSVIGGSRAVLQIESDNYRAEIELYDIGVTLNENGTAVSSRDYDQSGNSSGDESYWTKTQGKLVDEKNLIDYNSKKPAEGFKVGQKYQELLTVTNSGANNENHIDSFVRVKVYKYWVYTDEKGNASKHPELDASLINLHFVEGNGWTIDKKASNEERTVLYYGSVLPAGKTTSPFADYLVIDPAIQYMGKKTDTSVKTVDNKKITEYTATYDFDGMSFVIEAEVDAVQTHNAQKAVNSAWGNGVVTISGDSLTVN